MWSLFGARERMAMAESPPVEAPARHVEIKVVAKEEDRALVAVLTELLDRLQVTTTISTIPDLESEEMWNHPGATPAVARAWIDLRERGQVTVYLTGDQQDRVLVRQVPLVQSLDEVAREEIAHIIEAAVDELLLGGQIGVEKQKPPDQTPSVTLPPPLPEPPLKLDLGFGYVAQVWDGSEPPLHGPAAYLSLTKKGGPWRPGGWLSAELRFPADIEGNPVSMTLRQAALRLLFVSDHSLSNRWKLRGGVGGGFDWIGVAPKTTTTQGVALVQGNKFVPMLRALGFVRYAIASKSEVFFGLGADFDVQGTSFDTETYAADGTTSTQTIFHPWMVRPMALFGITADVFAY